MEAAAETRSAIVVPCYNEAARLQVDELLLLASLTSARIIIVDDGSTDGTAGLVRSVCRRSTSLKLVSLPHNVGKGEAVRAGLLFALGDGADVVAYCDADFATPASEVARLLGAVQADPFLHVALGSRVAMLGVDIRRSAFRHYTGRIFATLASRALQVPVYDTQCGAKAFRVTPALISALDVPFTSRWVFDVELLARILHNGSWDTRGANLEQPRIMELPLRQWTELTGSRFALRSRLSSMVDLARIYRLYR